MKTALLRHVRFLAALGCGVIAYCLASAMGLDVALLAAGDVFFAVFLLLCAVMVAGQTPASLRLRAKTEDEGMAVVILVILATIVFFCLAVFTALNSRHAGGGWMPLLLAGIGAPLGWFVLHTAMAFHYADIHYFDDPDCIGDEKDLLFPGNRDPGPWDFLYYAFVIGMTAQVSDVQVTTTVMRRATLLHGVVSFFFNTVFIAIAVNAAVALAS